MDKSVVNIIAGGNSFRNCDGNTVYHRGYTIGVNEAAIRTPVHVGVSMDRKWTEVRHEQIAGKPFLLRKPFKLWEGAFVFACNHETDEFSEVPGILNGRSSGHCALNYAYQMRPKKIFLFGFDFTGRPYWFGHLEWHKNKDKTYISNDWIPAFDAAKKKFDAAGIEVIIVGTESLLTQFKKITYEEYLQCMKL